MNNCQKLVSKILDTLFKRPLNLSIYKHTSQDPKKQSLWIIQKLFNKFKLEIFIFYGFLLEKTCDNLLLFTSQPIATEIWKIPEHIFWKVWLWTEHTDALSSIWGDQKVLLWLIPQDINRSIKGENPESKQTLIYRNLKKLIKS